jgi:stearoyl-CoA desaturase (delta-9 desaturase)
MYGVLNLPWWGYLVVFTIFTQLTIFSVTIYLHRCQAHRSLDLHPAVSHVFRFWLWMTTGMVTKEWTAIHRKHHARVETDEDPHSPVTRGIKKVLLEGSELYRAEAKNQDTLDRYGEGTPNDWIERNVYAGKRGSIAGVVLMFIINVVLFGLPGVTMWAMQMAWMPLFAAGVVNGLGHYWGYRNYESRDASRNITPIAFFLGGEELHNNHHAFATSAKFSEKWWEFDIGWMLIRILQFFGLAHPKRVVPKPVNILSKTAMDGDTIKALIAYRLQVTAKYTREVLMPMLRVERKRAVGKSRQLLRFARTALTRDSSLLKLTQQQRLRAILENFQSLRTVYQYRANLQEIWGRTTATQKELLEALQEWCRQAEATGIEALGRFATHLKTYVPQQVAR